MTGSVAQMVDSLPSNQGALSSNPSMRERERLRDWEREGGREEERREEKRVRGGKSRGEEGEGRREERKGGERKQKWNQALHLIPSTAFLFFHKILTSLHKFPLTSFMNQFSVTWDTNQIWKAGLGLYFLFLSWPVFFFLIATLTSFKLKTHGPCCFLF
jgi:hypothetical protein